MANPQEIMTLTPTEITKKPTKTGKTFWLVKTTEGISASIWKEDIAQHIELNLMQPLTVVIERNGDFTNIVGRAPAPDAAPPGENYPDPAQAPVVAAAPVVAPAAATPKPAISAASRAAAIEAAASFHNSTTDELADVFKTADLILAYIQGLPVGSEQKSSTPIDEIPDDLAPERFVQK
jgi:hypothetical protein